MELIIIDYRTLDDGNNLYDHALINMTLNITTLRKYSNDTREYVKCVRWKKTKADNFAELVICH